MPNNPNCALPLHHGTGKPNGMPGHKKRLHRVVSPFDLSQTLRYFPPFAKDLPQVRQTFSADWPFIQPIWPSIKRTTYG
jgi:hypothetical protein